MKMFVSACAGSLRSRGAAALFTVFLACSALMPAQQARALDDPAVEFMKQVSRDLIAAAKSGSAQAFAEVVNRYSHVQAIGLYALGSYKPQLLPADRATYYGGMVRFIARYAATEAQKYQVSHAQIFGPAQRTDRGVFVDSRVFLKDGSTYDVQWMLIPQGNTFRVRDAQVMSFWMTPFLKDLFEKYIGENGGRLQALMVALNR
jgi:phospholipid transport system substrate-binding protein